ncbi:TLC domain-containing protein [Auriculariales sp. MPI-PUGE-AT-0066]|nr:TLC domain-containing protein [Auriculariales sp. MPI-PUGE-AT-0066]
MDALWKFGSENGLAQLDGHLSTLLLSASAFTTLQAVVRACGGNEALVGRVNSMVHACAIVPLALAAMQSERLAADKAFGWDPRAGVAVAVACGYFLWDIVHSLTHYTGIGFVLHGVACFTVFILGFTPFVAYWGVRCLLFEVSTPFLNIQWYLIKAGLADGILGKVNGLLLLTSFFLARILFGGYIAYGFFTTLSSVADKMPWWYTAVYGVSNVLLNSLNVFWFGKMLAQVGGKSKANPKRTSKSD